MNSTNPNEGHWSPPPLVTHATAPTRALPATPAPRRRSNAGTWAAAICTAAFGITGGAIGATIADTTDPAEQAAPASCVEALEHADTLADESQALAGHFGALADLSAQAVEAAALWDADRLDAITLEVDALADDVQILADEHEATYAAYETARDDCRAEGGATR